MAYPGLVYNALRQQLAAMKAERDEAREIVSRINGATLGSEGYFITPSCVEAVNTLKANSNGYQNELAQLQADLAAACGELLVDINDAPPGSLAAKLVHANRVLRSNLATAQARVKELEGEFEVLQSRLTACLDLIEQPRATRLASTHPHMSRLYELVCELLESKKQAHKYREALLMGLVAEHYR